MSYTNWRCPACGTETNAKPASDVHRCGTPWQVNEHTTALTADAVAMLAEAGFTPEQWSRANYGDGTWTGDRCGCTDSRCVGFHHLDENCGCLPVLIDMALAGTL